MLLFEKIFQRNDRVFILFYFFTLGIFLYLSSMTSYYLRNETFNLPEIYSLGSILIVITFWILGLLRTRENRYIIGTAQFFRIEFILLIQTFFVCIILTVTFKVTGSYSRVWLFSTIILSLIILVILKVLFDFLYNYLITSNVIQRNILLIGDGSNCQNIIKKFPKKKTNSVIKCLIIIGTEDEADTYYYGIPKVNLKDDINYVLNHHAIGQIWIVSSIKTQIHIEKIIDKFMNYSVDCRLISPESKFKFIEGLDSEAGFDFYNISFSPFYGTNLLIKNFIDKILAIFFLIFTSPIIILSSIMILLQDGFPIIYRQKRTGWDGKSFVIYKLRTLTKSRDVSEDTQVERGDRRVTVLGSLLRRFSIDELPQFVNVLKGNMSVVGPRPHPIGQIKHFSTEIVNFMQRHKCQPGLTGWAQVNGFRGPKNSEQMDRRFHYDLYYIKNWNLMLDFYIIIKTFFVILFQKVD